MAERSREEGKVSGPHYRDVRVILLLMVSTCGRASTGLEARVLAMSADEVPRACWASNGDDGDLGEGRMPKDVCL